MKHYTIAIAGHFDYDSGKPTSVDVTWVHEEFWPVWEKAFGGWVPTWMYTPVEEAIPVVESALEAMDPARQKKVLERILAAMRLYPDSVIAWGVEDYIEEVWVDELPTEEK